MPGLCLPLLGLSRKPLPCGFLRVSGPDPRATKLGGGRESSEVGSGFPCFADSCGGSGELLVWGRGTEEESRGLGAVQGAEWRGRGAALGAQWASVKVCMSLCPSSGLELEECLGLVGGGRRGAAHRGALGEAPPAAGKPLGARGRARACPCPAGLSGCSMRGAGAVHALCFRSHEIPTVPGGDTGPGGPRCVVLAPSASISVSSSRLSEAGALGPS